MCVCIIGFGVLLLILINNYESRKFHSVVKAINKFLLNIVLFSRFLMN